VPVVDGAVGRRDAVVTSNPTHINAIAGAMHTRLTFEAV
jgi:hypothetical protein